MSQPTTIKPMPFWLSSLFFGIPSAIGWLGIYVGLPALARAGVPLFWNSLLCIVGPLALMLAAAFVAYRLEGNPLSWAGVRARFRLKPLRNKEWFWTLGLCLVCPGTYFLLLPTARWLASLPLFAPPEFLPSLGCTHPLRPDVSQVLPTEYAEEHHARMYSSAGIVAHWAENALGLVAIFLGVIR